MKHGQNTSVKERLRRAAAQEGIALGPFYANMLAAMIEVAARRKNARVPPWVGEIPALNETLFLDN